jgi:hypothetical protein
MSAPDGHWWSTLGAHFAADRRKTAVLAVMTVVMLIVWGRLFFKSDASLAAASQAAIVPELITTSSDAATSDRVSESAVEPVHEPALPASAAVDVSDAPRDLARELFAADWKSFRPALPTQPADGRSVEPQGLWGRFRAAARAESARQQRRAERIRRDAAGLVLQSTVIGRDPTAMVSGRLVRLGDRLDAFEVVEIGPGRVVVRKDGVRVVLVMP